MNSLLLDYLIPGVVIGVTAAFTPGALMMLLASESIRGGFRSGAKVAMVPLVTDTPFIIVGIIVAQGIAQSALLLGLISLIGAAFLTFVALKNLKMQQSDFQLSTEYRGSIRQAALVNLLNPNMYLWWFSVATPFFARGNMVGSAIFAAALLFCSVAVMLGMALGVTKVRMHIFDYAHWILRVLSIALIFFAYTLLQQGLSFLS